MGLSSPLLALSIVMCLSDICVESHNDILLHTYQNGSNKTVTTPNACEDVEKPDPNTLLVGM